MTLRLDYPPGGYSSGRGKIIKKLNLNGNIFPSAADAPCTCVYDALAA
jgi:hypothetical protein